MNLFGIPPLVVDILVLIIGLLVFINKKTKVNVLFSFFCLSVGIWLFGFSMMYFSKNSSTALVWAKIGFVGIIFIPILAFHFINAFLGRNTQVTKYIYLLSVPSLYLILTNLIYQNVTLHFYGYYPLAGKLYFLFLIQFSILISYVVITLLVNLRNPEFSILKRTQARYLFLAFGVGLLALVDYLAKYPFVKIYPFGYICTLIFISLIAFAIIKYRLMDIRIMITRAAIFTVVYLLVIGIPFWLGYRILNLTGYWYIPAVSGILLAFIGPLIYNVSTRKAENVILAEQKRYQKILRRASDRMKHIHNLDKLLELIVDVISKTVKVSYVTAYLNEPENNRYVLRAFKSSQANIQQEFRYDHPLIKYLKDKDEPFIYEELPEEIKKSLGEAGEIGLIVPSGDELSLVGFLIMGHKSNGSLFSDSDIDTFSIISNQASTQVTNCLHTEDAKKEQERTYKAERLSTIGAMATGVAHQFRNRLNNFVTLAGEIEFDIEDIQEFVNTAKEKGLDLSSFVDSLQNIAKRIHKCAHQTTDIIQGVIDFSSMEKQDPAPVEFKLSGFLGPCKSMLSVKHGLPEGESIPLKSELGENDSVFGDRVLLFKTVYNAIDNSFEAIEEKLDTYLVGKEKEDFVPEIKIGIEQKDRVSLIKISDNGIGIKEEDKSKVFAPYYTSKVSSKPSHSGVGMYSVKRSIEELLGGRVWIESEYTKGATFFIEIPRKPKA